MSLFEWNPKFSVGIQNMDKEHQKLFDTINLLYNAMKTGKGKEITTNVLNDLFEYTKTHFAHEEEMLRKYNYPDLNEQLSQHRAFEQKIQEQTEKQMKGVLLVNVEILNFLKDWLVNHIELCDQKYSAYLAENNIAASI